MTIEEQVIEYCKKYNVPLRYFFEILEDQKVVPMIRGKASEYNATFYLKDFFVHSIEWEVVKLNLNPQPDKDDQDLTIIHRKTGIDIRVEVKNAVRGSFTDGKRCRDLKVPHFSVKCHKSRSNTKKLGTTNDRYLLGAFDLIMSNSSNAIIEGGFNTMEDLPLIKNKNRLSILYNYYHVSNNTDLLNACYKDWRFAVPEEIALPDGSIPRTPDVYLNADADPYWFTSERLEMKLLTIVDRKMKQAKHTKHK